MTRLDPKMARGSAYGGLMLLLFSYCCRVSNSQFSGDCSLDQCRRPVERDTQDTPTDLSVSRCISLNECAGHQSNLGSLNLEQKTNCVV